MSIQTALCCPSCRAPLAWEVLVCEDCKTAYPRLNGVPFLFANPQQELARWEARAHHELALLNAQKQRCDDELDAQKPSVSVSPQTQRRLEHLSQAYAKQMTCVSELLKPLLRGQPGSDLTTYKALNTQLLRDNTTLFSYAANLFRDWVWGERENAQALSMLAEVSPEHLGNTLVLGAGGGRLAWDLSQSLSAQVTAVDINPLTTLAAARICSVPLSPERASERASEQAAEKVTLWEFPLAPIAAEDTAIERELAYPASDREDTAKDTLSFMLADARALPFNAGTFDTVVTPWFTDVVQQTPTATAQLINHLLKDNGHWLNFGSVAFADANPVDCLLLPELCALVANNGFTEPVVLEQQGPYLCSPNSRFGRSELLHSFCATKTATQAPPEQPATAPIWLTQVTRAVPALPAFEEQAMATQVHAYLMSLIDGQRSIDDIAVVLEERRLMSAREAVPVIQGFLQKMLDDG